MDKRKLKIALSLAVLIPCVLYAAGIIAQFIININAWKAAGSDYRTSPGLPSSQISEVVRALFHFPEGLIAIGVVVLGIAVLCVFGLRIGWGQNGVTDSDRNLTVSNSGSYGTASFMSPKEASACFEVTSAKRTSQDILGMLPDGQVLTLPKDTRLNANLAVCGSSGTGKSRAISRNLVLQAVKRGESVILTDPKSELYESMGEYLRENGYIVKVFNLVEMDHSDSWNCLGEVGSSELMAQTFADIVLQNTSGDSKDAFWYNAELNLLKALVLYVALEMPPEKRNIATVYDLLYTQTEKGLSDMMASISHEHANQYTGELLPPSPASAPYAIFRQSSETVRTSVIIGLGSKLAVLQAQQVRNITSYSKDWQFVLTEASLIERFYEKLFNAISDAFFSEINNAKSSIPEKGNKRFLKVFDAMLAFCARALNAIKASCLNSEFGAEHKLLSQMPITNFLQSIEGGKEMTLADKEKAYLWFISFVYRLRNALFHEIIDPLNDEWQVIFKNSYHVLKQVVDQNIWRLKQLKLLPSASQAAAEEDYNREPPPDIDWPTDEEAKFTWFYYEMLKLNKDGARVLLKGKIDFAEHHYETECTVRWNESLSETAIKNASITSVVDSQEKELAAAI